MMNVEYDCRDCGRLVCQCDTITQLRAIVELHQAREIEGMLVDVTTASLVVRVHDALNEKNRSKYASFALARMVDVAWKLAK